MGCCASEDGSSEPIPQDPFGNLMYRIKHRRVELKEQMELTADERRVVRCLQETNMKLRLVINEILTDTAEESDLWMAMLLHIAEQDALDIKEACDGFGTDEAKISEVMMRRLQFHFVMIETAYQRLAGRSLEDQIRGENKSAAGLFTGSLTNIGKILVYRCMEPAKRDAFLFKKAMSGSGCCDFILIELLSTRTNAELKAAAIAYAEANDGCDMVEVIKKETGAFGKKWYGKWVDTLLEFDRNEELEVVGDPVDLAEQLYNAGAAKWVGCDEQVFIDILCKANQPTIQAIRDAYDDLEQTKKSLEEDVINKMGGDLEFACIARVRTKHEFIAIRLFKAMKGWGTDEECLGRVLGCLDKQDVHLVLTAYDAAFGEEDPPYDTLQHLIESDTSGAFQDAMIMLLENFTPAGHVIPPDQYPVIATEARDKLEELARGKFDRQTAIRIGADGMHKPLQLIGLPVTSSNPGEEEQATFLRDGYVYDIEQMSAPYDSAAQRAEQGPLDTLFNDDPPDQDIGAAEELIRSLDDRLKVWRTKAEEFAAQAERDIEAYVEKAGCLRYEENYLHRIEDDNVAMIEFSANRDADLVQEACEGWGTDEEKIIRVLCALRKPQLQRVDEIFLVRYGKTLKARVMGEMGSLFEGKLKFLMRCLLTRPHQLDAEFLKESMDGFGTDDTLLCEIVCTRSGREIQAMKASFEQSEGKKLEEWVTGDTSGDFQKFLIRCLTCDRKDGVVDHDLAKSNAEELHQAGLNPEEGSTIDGDIVTRILAPASAEHIEAIKVAYNGAFGVDILEAVKTVGGNWEKALKARLSSKAHYIAQKINGALEGWGTDETAISRIFGRATKAELKQIKVAYEAMYNKSLDASIANDCSGKFKLALMTMMNAVAPGEGAGDDNKAAKVVNNAAAGSPPDNDSVVKKKKPKAKAKKKAGARGSVATEPALAEEAPAQAEEEPPPAAPVEEAVARGSVAAEPASAEEEPPPAEDEPAPAEEAVARGSVAAEPTPAEEEPHPAEEEPAPAEEGGRIPAEVAQRFIDSLILEYVDEGGAAVGEFFDSGMAQEYREFLENGGYEDRVRNADDKTGEIRAIAGELWL